MAIQKSRDTIHRYIGTYLVVLKIDHIIQKNPLRFESHVTKKFESISVAGESGLGSEAKYFSSTTTSLIKDNYIFGMCLMSAIDPSTQNYFSSLLGPDSFGYDVCV